MTNRENAAGGGNPPGGGANPPAGGGPVAGAEKTGTNYLTGFKEFVSASLGLIIIIATLVLMWPSLAKSPADLTTAQGIFAILGGWGGVILGYYFGRLPSEKAADTANKTTDKANQTTSNAHQVANTATQIALTASQTANNANKLAEASRQAAENNRQIAENAKNDAARAEQNKANAIEKCNSSLNEAEKSLQEILAQTKELKELATKKSASAESVQNVVSQIEEASNKIRKGREILLSAK